ncbi:hypothetical protein M3Y94_00858000 [Aphelenchoides besseyi]|nr:hypothetical protein M3Y94_00858000 [Aphelenchoides besseyi]
MVYALLEKPKRPISVCYHIAIFGYIVFVHVIHAWNPEDTTKTVEFILKLERWLAIYFLIEFVLRIWSAGADGRFQGWTGRKLFICRPMCLIDTTIMGVTIVLVWLMKRHNTENFMDVLRFVQILRLLHIDRQMISFSLLKQMVQESRLELVTIYYITIFLLALLACVVYTIEEEPLKEGKLIQSENATFANYGESFWFSAVTIFTIGYGDIIVQKWQSKIVVCVIAYLGLVMFGAASTLVGVQMSLTLENRNKEQKQSKVRLLAACVIQCWWRYHLINNEEKFRSIPVYTKFCVKLNAAMDKLIRARQSARRELSLFRRNGRSTKTRSKKQFVVNPIATTNVSISSDFDIRNALKTNTTPAIYISTSELKCDDMESTRSLPRCETQTELQRMARLVAERGRRSSASVHSIEPPKREQTRTSLFQFLRRKNESVASSRLIRDDSIETNDSQSPEREETDDLYYEPSITSTVTLKSDMRSVIGNDAPLLTGKHRAILRILYFILFMSWKKKFSRARKPYELNEAEQELLELEHKKNASFATVGETNRKDHWIENSGRNRKRNTTDYFESSRSMRNQYGERGK